MPIPGIPQPEILPVDPTLRLRRFDGQCGFALPWYQDEDTVYLVDGVRKSYDLAYLHQMYTWLDQHGELYFIETLQGNRWTPIGDVTFWQEDMPIVIGDRASRKQGIGRKVIAALIQRGWQLGYDSLRVNEIYAFNIASQKCFERVGFQPCGETEKGKSYILRRTER